MGSSALYIYRTLDGGSRSSEVEQTSFMATARPFSLPLGCDENQASFEQCTHRVGHRQVQRRTVDSLRERRQRGDMALAIARSQDFGGRVRHRPTAVRDGNLGFLIGFVDFALDRTRRSS